MLSKDHPQVILYRSTEPVLTGVTILVCLTASTFIMMWLTTELALHVLICRIFYHPKELRTSRMQKCNAEYKVL
jgi:hypothetical protein